jgi:glycosyltransferase involved in cell wall biosynthesis
VTQPLVSVVMTVLEPHPRFFPEAVASVLAQSYANWELVIVEDPSPASAALLLQQFPDARIRHVCNPERTSHSRQRNQSLSLARGELVATLDADDRSHAERLARQVAFLATHPEIAVVGSQLTIIDATGNVCGARSYPCSPAEILQAFPRYNPLAQPSVMFRKSIIQAAGGYQYDLYPAVEDYDLWSRLAAGGAQLANLPEALLEYRLHPGGMKATRLKGLLRGTLDVKQRYWRQALGWHGHLRMLAERMLLLLPPAVTYQLFQWLVLKRPGGARR